MPGLLGLRLRIFLFFALLAVGGAALAAGALAFGWSRAEADLPTGPFITAFIVFAFLNAGLALGIWLLFDEHLAKPINRLAAALRLQAHAGVPQGIEAVPAPYLGDLAPAARALSKAVHGSLSDTAGHLAAQGRSRRADSAWLTDLLSEIPIATLLLNPAQEIVLYDAQAADILSAIAPPRLKAPLSDYFDPASLAEATSQLSGAVEVVEFRLQDTAHTHSFDAKLKALSDGGHMLFIDIHPDQRSRISARPLVFDFDLMSAADTGAIHDTPLKDLCFVAFDTETTGLSVSKDDVVQLGAVRVLNGRVVEGEVVDTYVNPGRPIPPASTRIHKITDADVAGAPGIAKVARALHHFSQEAVLVAHNAPFDIGLLRKYAPETGVEWDHPVLDTVLLSAVIFGTTEAHTLDALCDRLAITIPPELRHTALGDARATADALVKLLPLLEGRGIRTFGELVQETRKHGRLLRDMNA